MENSAKEILEELVSAISYLEDQPWATNEKYDLLVNDIVNKYWDICNIRMFDQRKKVEEAIKKFNKRGGEL